MTGQEEQLELGSGPPRGRRTAVVVALLAVLAAGWGVWRGGSGDEPAPPHRPGSSSERPSPAAGAPRSTPLPAPLVPYLRSGVLVRPDGTRRGVPDLPWTDVEELPDGRVVLALPGSVTVLGPERRRAAYPLAGTLVHRPDRTAVAWRRPDGVVVVLGADDPTPQPVRASVLQPSCRGLRGADVEAAAWRTCDADGHPVDPRGGVALVGARSLALALRSDLTSAVTWPTHGTVADTAWEPDGSLLAVVVDDRRVRLVRFSGVAPPLTLLDTISYDPARPLLVLP